MLNKITIKQNIRSAVVKYITQEMKKRCDYIAEHFFDEICDMETNDLKLLIEEFEKFKNSRTVIRI